MSVSTVGSAPLADYPRKDTLPGLPAELTAHVEFCRSKGLDLVPWIDPYREPPPRPIVGQLDAFCRTVRSERTRRSVRNILQRFIEEADVFDAADLIVPVMHYWVWLRHDQVGVSMGTLGQELNIVKRFGRFVGGAVQELRGLKAVRHSRALSRTKQERLLRELKKPGARRQAVAEACGVSVNTVRKYARRGVICESAGWLYGSEEPAWHRRCGEASWLWKSLHGDDPEAPTYHDLIAILEENNRLAEGEKRLPDATYEERVKSRQRIAASVYRAQKAEDYGLKRRERQGAGVGSLDLLRLVVGYWHTAKDTPTYGSPTGIRRRFNGFPERIRVAIAGWEGRRKIAGGQRGLWHVRGLLKTAKSQPHRKPDKNGDRRGAILLRWMEENKLTRQQARLQWNRTPLEERKRLSPGNWKPIRTDKTAKELVWRARGSGRCQGYTMADRQPWPPTPEEEQYRKLHDEQGKSLYQIAKVQGNGSGSARPNKWAVWKGIWRARVDHDPQGTLAQMAADPKIQLARRALELWEQGTVGEALCEALETEGVKRGRSRYWGRNMAIQGRFWRALQRRAEELLAKGGGNGAGAGQGNGQAGGEGGQIHVEQPEPKTAPRKKAGGRPRKWDRLWGMIQEADAREPRPCDKDIASEFNRKYAALGLKATAHVVKKVRYKYGREAIGAR